MLVQKIGNLKRIEFLKDIDAKLLEELAKIATLVEFPGNHVIFRQDDPGSNVYFIVSGRVSLVIRERRIGNRQLMEVGPGELVGWSPLVGRTRLSDTAQTLTPVKAIAVDGEEILALCAKNPEFGFQFMQRAAQTLADRLSAARRQLLKATGQTFPEVQLESD